MSLWDLLTLFFPRGKRARLEALKYMRGIANRSIKAGKIAYDAVTIKGKSYDVISDEDIDAGEIVRVLHVSEEGVLKVETILSEQLIPIESAVRGTQSYTYQTARTADKIHTKMGKIIEASEDILVQNDDEKKVNTISFTLYKEFKIWFDGKYRVKFDMKHDTGAGAIHGQIYKNGQAYGLDRVTASTLYQTYSEDLIFEKGDLCQLYCYVTADTGRIRNFRLYGKIVTKAGEVTLK